MAAEYPDLLELANKDAYRARFEALYCCGPLMTFDGISVRFRLSDFNHAFYSSNRLVKKVGFSIIRAQRMEWINVALKDRDAELFQGWDWKTRQVEPERRVALVQANYLVAIRLTGIKTAVFQTAYPIDRQESIDKVRSAPKWA